MSECGGEERACEQAESALPKLGEHQLTVSVERASGELPCASPGPRGKPIKPAAMVASGSQNQNSPFSKLESNNVDVEKWKQTFSKIMARSYKNNANNSSGAKSE